MTDYYISPIGTGDRSGRTVENAAAIEALNSLVNRAAGGDRIVLVADQGGYTITKSINLYCGGDEGNPITIIGMSSTGQEMAATFLSNRADVYSPTAAAGAEIFRLNEGASNLVFANVDFKNVATAFRLGGDLKNITIQDSASQNLGRFVENLVTGKNVTASVDGLTIRNVDVEGFAKGVVRLQYDTRDVVIENVNGDSQHIDGANFAIGVHLDGTAHDVVIRNAEIGNITDTTNKYHNGDGFATERGVYNVLFDHTRSYNNTDAGYDIKSTATQLIDATADGNTRNFRFWATDTVADNIVGLNPTYHGGSNSTPSNVWLASGANAEIVNSHFLDDDSTGFLFDMAEKGATLVIKGVESNQDVTGNAKLTDPVILGKTSTLIGTVIDFLRGPDEIHATANTILENAASGMYVANVNSKGATHYTLSDDANGMFRINADTGDIFLANNAGLDYEKAHSFAVSVVASNAHGATIAAAVVLDVGNIVENQNVVGTTDDDSMIFTSDDNWTVDGGDGSDIIMTFSGADRVKGGAGDDCIYTGGGDDVIIYSTQKNGGDILDGGAGWDEVRVTKNNVHIGLTSITNIEAISSGGRAGVKILGSSGDDNLDFSNTKIDRITNPIDLGAGNDIAIGNAQDNGFLGGVGNDVIIGAGGKDTIDGGVGDDWIYGDLKGAAFGAGDGNDVITGGLGNDHLFGGNGNDKFVYRGKVFGHDSIHDFGQAIGDDDVIDLSGLGLHFADLAINYGSEGAHVQLGAGSSILMSHVTALSASDFIF